MFLFISYETNCEQEPEKKKINSENDTEFLAHPGQNAAHAAAELWCLRKGALRCQCITHVVNVIFSSATSPQRLAIRVWLRKITRANGDLCYRCEHKTSHRRQASNRPKPRKLATVLYRYHYAIRENSYRIRFGIATYRAFVYNRNYRRFVRGDARSAERRGSIPTRPI